MNTRKTEKTTNSRLFNKGILPVAVATAMFGGLSANAAQFQITSDATIGNNTSNNSTTNYLLNGAVTLTTNSTMTTFYGTIDGNTTSQGTDDGMGQQIVIAGNLTMHGNIGATNGTGNFTINAGNALTLASNVSVFNTSNITISDSSTLNLGNTTTGYNRGATDLLTISANISVGNNGTINVGNGTTLDGVIYGTTDGVGTLNIHGNFTSGGGIGDEVEGTAHSLSTINVLSGNTFTLQHNATATSVYVNGTLKAVGPSGNITGNVLLGSSGKVYLNRSESEKSASANITGTINGNGERGGSLYINGTYTTAGEIGGSYGLNNIYLDNENTSISDNTYVFAHSVNATNIILGSSTSSRNATLTLSKASVKDDGMNIVITGNIVGGGNYTSGGDDSRGILAVNATNAVVDGTIGTSDAYLSAITIADRKILTAKGSIYSGNITLQGATNLSGGNTTLAINGTANTAYTINGAINGERQGDGRIDVNSGNVTFANQIGNDNYIAAINVASGAEMKVSNHIYANETITVLGTLSLTSAANFTFATTSGSAIGLKVGNNSGTNGTLTLGDTLTLNSSVITTASGGSNAT